MTHRITRLALVAVLPATLAAHALGAQSFPTGPATERALRDPALVHQVPGRFLVKSAAVHAQVVGAQRASMLAQLSRITELLRASLGTLPGVEADVSPGASLVQLPGGGSMIGGDVKLLLWPYSVRNGRLAFYENAAELIVWVNHSACRGPDAIGNSYGFMLAPRVNGRFHGFPMLDSTVVITHRTQPPCIPVTRGEIFQALSHTVARETARGDSTARADAADQERALRELEKSNPAMAAQARADMARMKRMSDSMLASARGQFDGALAAMSPAERASPAYLVENGCRSSDLRACLVDASTPGARAVVRENPAFFDTTRPADVQIITFELRPLEGARRNAAYPTAVMDTAFARLDWAALSALAR